MVIRLLDAGNFEAFYVYDYGHNVEIKLVKLENLKLPRVLATRKRLIP